MKRSNAPMYWLPFGAGGMLSALIAPVLVVITGIAVPLGLFLPRDLMNYPNMLAFAQNWAGKGFLFVVVSLFMWHGAHRIFHGLHDIGIRTGVIAWLLCYGVTLVCAAAAAVALISLGF